MPGTGKAQAEAALRLLSSDTHNERLPEIWHRALWALGTAQPGISVLRYFTFSDLWNLIIHQERKLGTVTNPFLTKQWPTKSQKFQSWPQND